MSSLSFSIRPPIPPDIPALAVLCSQLGYPSTPAQVQARLNEIFGGGEQAVFIAELEDGTVAGWAHALRCVFLESDAFVELAGLVVAEGLRHSGIGRGLLEAVEGWTRAQGIPLVRLRSNVIRTEAHTFYRRAGYSQVKTQVAFDKRV